MALEIWCYCHNHRTERTKVFDNIQPCRKQRSGFLFFFVLQATFEEIGHYLNNIAHEILFNSIIPAKISFSLKQMDPKHPICICSLLLVFKNFSQKRITISNNFFIIFNFSFSIKRTNTNKFIDCPFFFFINAKYFIIINYEAWHLAFVYLEKWNHHWNLFSPNY